MNFPEEWEEFIFLPCGETPPTPSERMSFLTALPGADRIVRLKGVLPGTRSAGVKVERRAKRRPEGASNTLTQSVVVPARGKASLCAEGAPESLASAFQTHINRRPRRPFLGAIGSVPDQPGQNTVRGGSDEGRLGQNLPWHSKWAGESSGPG